MREDGRNKVSPDEKIKFQEKSIDCHGENRDSRFDEKGKRIGSSGFQELTLSYLCESSKMGLPENDILGKNLLNSLEKLSSGFKGKEIQGQIDEDCGIWVERDFLRLNENRRSSSKRDAENVETTVRENIGKKVRVESLDLSLALPDVSHFNTGSNRIQNGDIPSRLGPIRSVQSVGPSFNNAQTTYSLSCSYSHPVSHNHSCSLTMNSTENNEYSMGSHRKEGDQIWNCGEGTNGSVHSRFKPIGDGTVALSNHGGDGGLGMGNRRGFNKDSLNNIFCRTKSSENLSFYPPELPARPRTDDPSGDLRGKGLENLRDSEDYMVGKEHKRSRPERILTEIVSESIPVMAQIIQEVTDETLDSTIEYLKNVIVNPERKEEFVDLQKRLERRSDLNKETLSKWQKTPLQILVAIKMGLASFLNGRNELSTSELVDIFQLERCRNINCKRLLPVDDCDCKICLTKKGFCSECMCPVCFNFDCAINTCSWVGCDVCSHWCHAACGLQRNVIKPGPSLKGHLGKTEMQFYCLGCDHTSEMFGFIKEVFVSCAKDWKAETLIKELDCVSKIFQGSKDRKGKELHFAANEMLLKLENKALAPSDVCNLMCQFFDYADGLLDLGDSPMPTKASNGQPSFEKAASTLPSFSSLTPKTSLYSINASSGQHEFRPIDPRENLIIQDEWSVKPVKKGGVESLENLVRMKEAEARMFQNRADEAQGEVESLRRIMRINTEKMEEEYASQLAKLCLPELEERKRKKVEELKELENSHCDYYNMKIRMQSEISGLLKRMEATKQQLV
ncbi:protein OBERON 3 [Dorcoceras hygrometricum]|uniref:Protein OBERON 3 n=1 Tax=Dorcoceras hygrometricum TaxID=472368 RepID=A0A2Z7DIE9_9LAMI|nr:protein OBERON 3 [Dorcoceras hygrometricum]